MRRQMESRPSRRGFQFSVGALLITMAVVGVVCVAFRTPNSFWLGIIVVMTLLLILTNMLVAIHRTGAARAFAIGYLVFSVGYLVGLGWLMGNQSASLSSDDLPAGQFARWVSNRIHPPGTMQFSTGPRLLYHIGDFKRICNFAAACLLGLIGGVLSQILYLTRRNDTETVQNE